MGKFIYLMSFLSALDPAYQNAGDNSRQALLETSMMKDELKDLEDRADKQLKLYGLTRDNLSYMAYAYPLVAGKISSKPFKNLEYKSTSGVLLRPEVEYIFRDKSYSTLFVLIKEY